MYDIYDVYDINETIYYEASQNLHFRLNTTRHISFADIHFKTKLFIFATLHIINLFP